MNWLAVIKAGREFLAQTDEDEEEKELEVDEHIFQRKQGCDAGLPALESAALTAIVRATCAQLQILALGTGAPSNSAIYSAGENLLRVLQDTEVELKRESSFKMLSASAQEEAQKMKKTQLLEAIAVRNKAKIENLRSKLEGNEHIKQRELHKKQECIAQLKDQILELVAKRDVSLSYIERSEISRREQNLMRCQRSEKQLREDVISLNTKISAEFRVHEDLTTFLHFAMKNLEDDLDSWKKFYESEMIRRNDKLKVLRSKIADERLKLLDLTGLYMEHQKEMNDYLEYKEQKRIEAEHDQFIYDTATKIQAWWRGTMVRRGLGPYKKRKKPGKDKKKKK